jgi:hypothetical protein
MKLYNVPRNSLIRVIGKEVITPPTNKVTSGADVFRFSHIDGMYSYCVDEHGDVVHLAAWTEVEVLDDNN